MADEVTDAQIAAAWPERWQRANDPNLGNRSKARQQLRKAWRLSQEFASFKTANPKANCGNCQYLAITPHTKKMHCELDSDFHGYQLVQDETSVCTRHARKWRVMPERPLTPPPRENRAAEPRIFNT